MNRAETRQQLVDHYLDYYALAKSMLNDDDDARDAVQEALARTMAMPLLQKPVAYCFQTVRRVAVDTMRYRMRTRSIEEYELPDESDEGDSYAMLLERVGMLREGMPTATKALLKLRYEKGLTYSELEKLTGLSMITIRRRLKEAKQIIKEKLEEEK
ncbi:MAG: sigma-70 family RNA polymerase sigma factor [Bacteroidales bacterium]|nr:sigma-70 family RNA polymerase sigma factor [Bacteroidales bacterium]